MSESITEPTTLRAGDSASWVRSVPGFPASDGWVLAYRLLTTAGKLDIATTATGDDFAVSVAAASTAALPAGQATLVGAVTKADERITVYSAKVGILPNLAAAETYDGRSWAQRALEAARAALLSYAEEGKGHVASYSIAGRSMTFRSTDDILKLITKLESDVAKENTIGAILAGGTPGRILTRNR